nr:diacylglycerol O-acyltransferase 1-like [Ipomoea batatas]
MEVCHVPFTCKKRRSGSEQALSLASGFCKLGIEVAMAINETPLESSGVGQGSGGEVGDSGSESSNSEIRSVGGGMESVGESGNKFSDGNDQNGGNGGGSREGDDGTSFKVSYRASSPAHRRIKESPLSSDAIFRQGSREKKGKHVKLRSSEIETAV